MKIEELTELDIGRAVIVKHPSNNGAEEFGFISKFDDSVIFVVFGGLNDEGERISPEFISPDEREFTNPMEFMYIGNCNANTDHATMLKFFDKGIGYLADEACTIRIQKEYNPWFYIKIEDKFGFKRYVRRDYLTVYVDPEELRKQEEAARRARPAPAEYREKIYSSNKEKNPYEVFTKKYIMKEFEEKMYKYSKIEYDKNLEYFESKIENYLKPSMEKYY